MIWHKQTAPYGCGLYGAANTLQLDNYVTPERVEESKLGTNNGRVSRWLQDDGHMIYIDPVWYDNFETRELPDYCKAFHSGDADSLMPVFLTVKSSEFSTLSHFVGVWVGNQHKEMWLLDSYNDAPVEVHNWADIESRYYGIYQYSVLWSLVPAEVNVQIPKPEWL